jgi:DHA3 family macrolide efflux protein-like MFS transporter
MTIFAGQTVSILTTYAASFAALWYITRATASPLYLALAGVAALLPIGLLSPVGGVVADRFSRKTVMIVADATVGALSLGIAAVVALTEAPIAVLLIFLAVRASAQAFHSPAMTAALAAMAPEAQLVRVNSLSQGLVSLAGIVGPALGIWCYEAVGFAGVLVLDAAGALVACLALLPVPVPAVRLGAAASASPSAGAAVRPSLFADFKEGLRAFLADRPLMVLFGFMAMVMLLAVPLGTLFPLVTYQVFNGNGYQASLVEAVWAFGLLAGSAGLLIWGGGKRPALVAVGGAGVIGLAATACGFLRGGQFVLFVVLAGIIAMAVGAFSAPIVALTQKRVPDELLGRVTGIIQTVTTLAAPVGLVAAGLGAQRLGLSQWFCIAGAILVISALAAGLSRNLRSLR